MTDSVVIVFFIRQKYYENFDSEWNCPTFVLSIDTRSMKKKFFSWAMMSAFVAFVSVFTTSCVDEKYEISKDKVNMNVTLFQEGVSLPLGSLSAVRMDSLIAKLGLGAEFEKYFAAGEDGAYSITMRDQINVTEQLSGLTDILKLDKVEFSEEVSFNLTDVDIDKIKDLKVEAVDESYTLKFADVVDIPEIKVPEIKAQTFEVAAGLHDLAIDKDEINKLISENIKDIDVDGVIAELAGDVNIPASSQNNNKIPIVDGEINISNTLKLKAELVTEFESDEPLNFTIETEFPKGITDISEVSLKGSELRVTMGLSESFFVEGYIEPTVHLDLHNLFELSGADEDPLHPNEIDSNFLLSHTNGWSQAHTFNIDALILNEGDLFFDNESGVLKLRKNVSLKPYGTLNFRNLYTTTNKLVQNGKVKAFVDIQFSKLVVDDVVFSVEDMDFSVDRNVPVQANAVSIPEQVESVGTISFKEGSKISLEVAAENVPEGLGLNLQSLDFVFPEMVKLNPGAGYKIDGNRLTISNQSISSTEKIKIDINVAGFDMPEPVNGQIKIDETVRASAVAVASARNIKLSDIPTSSSDDLKLIASIKPTLEFEDCTFKLAEEGFKMDAVVFEFDEALPSSMKNMGKVSIALDNNPYIKVETSLPDIKSILGPDTDIEIIPSAGGLALTLPEFLKFNIEGEDAEYYNHYKHALEYTTDFAENVTFPISKIELDPSQTGGRIQGVVQVLGGVTLKTGEISYSQLRQIVDSGAEASFHVEMSELRPKIELGEYEMSLGRMEYDMDIIGNVEIPDMIEQVQSVELDDVNLSLEIDSSEFPVLGESAQVDFDVNLSLPEFVVLDKTDDRVVNNSVKLTLEGRSTDKGVAFEMKPIKIESLDLSGIDFGSTEPVDQKIVIDVSFRIKNAELGHLFGKEYNIGLNACVRSGDRETIDIKAIKARVNYAIDPIEQVVDLSGLSDMLKGQNMSATFDLNRFYIALDVKTNLGVSAKAEMKLVPYFNGAEATDRIVRPDKPIAINGAPQASDTTVTRLWISNTDKGMPSGYNYVNLDIMSLLKDIPDSIKFNLSAGTDAKSVCTFEPGAKYVLKAEYAAGIPMEFGDDFKFVYRDTIPDIPAELADILAYGSLGLGGYVESSLPLNMHMSVNMLDSKGRVINVGDQVGKQIINSCDREGRPVISPIDLLIANNTGADLSDVKSLEVMFKVDSKNVGGVPFRKDSFIRAVLTARIPEGLTLDLGSVMESASEDATLEK